MSIVLRDYQLEAINAVNVSFREGVNRQLISLPTGSGKTVVMAALAMQLNKKTIVLAHREELITQAVDKFKLVWPEASIGVCMADRDEIHNQVIIGSIQSCSRPKRLAKLKELGFELMMIDEAHHSIADSYQNIIGELGFSDGSISGNLLVGVTATPYRADRQGLGKTFEKITFSRSIDTMIKAGYLSPVIGRKILTSFVLKKMCVNNGDFSLTDLAEAVNTHERNVFIAEKYKSYATERKGVAFCVDVQHCKDLAEALKCQGIEAKAVWGDMETDDRKGILEDLKKGRIQVVTSCGVLCEGFDEPSLDAVIMARPTKSQSLYIQCVGRGLRLWPGKANCLVLDFTDRNNNLDGIMSLSNTIPEAFMIKERELEVEREEIDRSPKIEVFEEVDKEFDILGSTRFIWIPIGDGEWSLLDDEKREIVMSPSDRGFVATLYYPDGTSRQIVKTPIPLEYCSGVCEDFSRRHLKIAFADMNSSWMRSVEKPTQGQREYLKKKNVYRDEMNKAEAAIEIRRVISLNNKHRRTIALEPITPKQKHTLINYGIDPKRMNKLEAMMAISKIKQSRVS